jgi:hypothetical protein
MADVEKQIVDLIRSIDFEDAEQGYRAFSQAMEDMYPHASHNDIAKAQKILEGDYRTELVDNQASIATVRRMLTLVRKTVPDGIRFDKVDAEETAAEGQGIAFYQVELVDWSNPTPVA